MAVICARNIIIIVMFEYFSIIRTDCNELFIHMKENSSLAQKILNLNVK